jgi:hypothetical protein
MLHYYSVPALFFSIFALNFLKLNQHPQKWLYPFTSGICFALLVFSRMPTIVFLLMPVACLLASYFWDKANARSYLIAYLRMLGVILACFFAFTLLLQYHGLLKCYFIYELPSKHHSSSALFSVLADHLLEKIPYMLGLAVFAYCFYLLIEKQMLSGKKTCLIFLGILALSISLVVLSLKFPMVKEIKLMLIQPIWPDSFDVYPILVAINLVFIYLLRKSISFQEVVLIILALSWPFLKGVGSAAGLKCGIIVGFLLCGTTSLLLLRVARLYNCRIPLFSLGIMLAIVIGGKAFKDNFDFSKNRNINIERLNGIYTTPERADNFISLIHALEKHVKKGDHILACPYMPMVYYASGTSPLGNHPSLFFLDIGRFSSKLDEIAKMPPPVAIVKPKIDFDDPFKQQLNFEWPTTREFLAELYEKIALFDQKIMGKWNAELIWSNDHYEIYQPRNI